MALILIYIYSTYMQGNPTPSSPPPSPVIGIWTSAAELANLSMSGDAWTTVLAAADAAYPNQATVSDQDSNNNVQILAAAIVYARTGIQSYRDKVVAACVKLVSGDKPAGNTLAWAREIAAYVMAADLVGYRTPEFETWCRNMADVYVATDGRTMRQMFEIRPNNWGTMAFGSLTAIYRYLGDNTNLTAIRDYWIQLVVGPKPEPAAYGGPENDLSWHFNESDPRQINPQGSVKQGINIDGILPDDLRRGGSLSANPGYTGYPWEAMQGLVTAARVLDRAGMSIWAVGNNAIYRAVYALQVRLGWVASGDDAWMLIFLNKMYGTNWTSPEPPSRIWGAGKIAGWGYVTLGE